MTPDTYQKYEKFTRRLQILKDPSLKGCPTVDCEGFLRRPLPHISNNLSLCCECNKNYCFKCLHLIHPGETCEQKIDKEY